VYQITVSVGVPAIRDVPPGGEKPNVRRKYLSPDEARRVIEASARAVRQGERDKLLLTLIYRHCLRVSKAVDLRWTDFDLDASKARPFHVRRLRGSKDSVHMLEPDIAKKPSHAGPEQIFETYYNVAATKWLNVTLDYQLVNHPAYNAGRGPVHVFGLRLHTQF
jgi:integrase